MTPHRFQDAVRALDIVGRTGRVKRIMPTYIEADGPSLPLGGRCRVQSVRHDQTLLAEVVGVQRDCVVLAPLEEGQTFSGAVVAACPDTGLLPVGDAFMGRAVDAVSRPIDGGKSIRPDHYRPRASAGLEPMARTSPRQRLDTGIRAIDGLLTLGRGQRVGVFAAAGVGKTSMLTQLAQQVDIDRCVVCLIGERGREVEAFWSRALPSEIKAKTTLVAATSDRTAAMRVQAAEQAMALAEYWRSEGHHVHFLLDSVTRLAMALREIGLAAGEPPTVRAYTPNVFAAVPRLVERCGALKNGGSITAVMTVLSETDEVDDPISEMMKSLLDGHIVLSRSLAQQGHYPAIDISRSISRLAPDLVPDSHRSHAAKAAEMLGVYEASRTLIEAGVYTAGTNTSIDLALEVRPDLLRFLRQARTERTSYAECSASLAKLVEGVAR